MKSLNENLLPMLIAMIFLGGCKKDGNETITQLPEEKYLNVNFNYEVDSAPLTFNLYNYTNDAGNNYSTTAIMYYISQISLIKTDSVRVLLKNYMLQDASAPKNLSIPFSSIPTGNYIGLSFNIGLDSIQNISHGLPATLENLAMEWPDAMGGGYHFLKLEGHYNDSGATPGYAMHLGTNPCLRPVDIFKDISISGSSVSLILTMNVNEWFRDPFIYDFNLDGNYSMGNMAAMTKISENGYNVFSIK